MQPHAGRHLPDQLDRNAIEALRVSIEKEFERTEQRGWTAMAVKIPEITNDQRSVRARRRTIERRVEAVRQHACFSAPGRRVFAHHQIERFLRGHDDPVGILDDLLLQTSVYKRRQVLIAAKRVMGPWIAEMSDPWNSEPGLQQQSEQMIRHWLAESHQHIRLKGRLPRSGLGGRPGPR